MKTKVRVVTKTGNAYNFSFDGEFSLKDYIKKQTTIINDVKFLRVNLVDTWCEYQESVLSMSEVAFIKAEHSHD